MSFISPVATDTSGNQKTTGSAQTLGKDDFLQLLVVKMQNQDPLSPMADEDFIAQLAQFSSLEQMQNIADGITTSNQWDYLQMQSLNNAMASSLIGKDILAQYKSVHVDSTGSAQINFTLDKAANSVTFTVKNGAGETVATLSASDLSKGINSITWDGKDQLGNSVDEGDYTVTATGTDKDGNAITPKLSVTGTVEKIIYYNGAAYVTVNGMQISLSDIAQVAEKGSLTD